MLNVSSRFAIMAIMALSVSAKAVTQPDPQMTPGVLCSEQDPNFMGLYYKEKIPRCKRNVNTQEKVLIASRYGNIPQSDWPNYEFDHLIPLCAGGSDDVRNLWPQPRTDKDSLEKDKLEDQICIQMTAGTLTQAQAVQKIHDFFNSMGQQNVDPVANSTSPQQP